ncbi:hypothetical protein M2150_001042 [Lachnospiraceae bacterium PM6-15]|uniref:ORC-CDC6 family AAA ATPase n=1 Tax=Ohessyouella blattaphilus TaxID=2949333 RepID=UPI003E1C7122
MAIYIRTEDIKLEEIPKLYVEMQQDKACVESLKSTSPVIIIGSRGVGKSFLLRLAQYEQLESFSEERVFPVYTTLRKSSLIHTSDSQQFYHWMLARICHDILRSLRQKGLIHTLTSSISMLTGESDNNIEKTAIELIMEAYENSWQNPAENIDISALPTIDNFVESIEDLCQTLNIDRINLLIDEAAHVFIPSQQRQFFTLFRDMRSPYLTVNAAVYPGVTIYGDTFQASHDATMIDLHRDITDKDYINAMRELVKKQSDSDTMNQISQNRSNFAILAYSCGGNPRHLLKTIMQTGKLNSNNVNTTIREYYRSEIWAEHSQLSEKYAGLRPIIDWGRNFIEEKVLPEISSKNIKFIEDGITSSYFWIHRDAPQLVNEALRILEYTGIISGHSQGIKASRSNIGTRYCVNFGCLLSLEDRATARGTAIAEKLSIKRMTEFGMNNGAFDSLIKSGISDKQIDLSIQLKSQMEKSIDILDLTPWQKDKLHGENLNTIDDVLRASESDIMNAYYVGDVRARQMKNSAYAAIYEYLAG